LEPWGAYHFPRKRNELGKLLRGLARYADIIHIHSVHSIFSVAAGLALANPHSARIVVTPHYHGTGHTYVRKILWLLWR
jgi:hypothetical protein